MRKLWVQLTLAFSLVTVVGVAIVALLANRQVSADFRSFVAQSQVQDSPLVTELSDYYAAHASWAGVESVLRDFAGARRGMMGRGGPIVILADAAGQVVYSETQGRQQCLVKKLLEQPPIFEVTTVSQASTLS